MNPYGKVGQRKEPARYLMCMEGFRGLTNYPPDPRLYLSNISRKSHDYWVYTYLDPTDMRERHTHSKPDLSSRIN